MPKYKEYALKMLSDNKEFFESFRKLHDEYALDPERLQKKFNEEGEKVLEIVREYENRLCANTERGMYNKFSTGLSEKFQGELKKIFPMIDHIGLIIDSQTSQKDLSFVIKKIKL